MALSSDTLTYIADTALDWYLDKGTVYAQSLQNKPLLQQLENKAKTFPGGKGAIDLAVKGDYTATVSGYNGDDAVTYATPENVKRVNFPWKEHHTGISITMTELKMDGISVVDSARGDDITNHAGREQTMLVNLFQDKLDDMMEGYARGMNTHLWGDGTTSNVVKGVRSIVLDDPSASSTTIGGLRSDTNTWWRNRFKVGAGAAYTTASTGSINTSATGTELIEAVHSELRQLRRYGGRPDIALCGRDFLDRLSDELRRNGNYTQTGFGNRSATDIGMAEIHYGGLVFRYDPTLDDLTDDAGNNIYWKKRCYMLDSSKLALYYMDGERQKRHSPARPETKYVIYRAITTTCALVATQLNCHGVYQFA